MRIVVREYMDEIRKSQRMELGYDAATIEKINEAEINFDDLLKTPAQEQEDPEEKYARMFDEMYEEQESKKFIDSFTKEMVDRDIKNVLKILDFDKESLVEVFGYGKEQKVPVEQFKDFADYVNNKSDMVSLKMKITFQNMNSGMIEESYLHVNDVKKFIYDPEKDELSILGLHEGLSTHEELFAAYDYNYRDKNMSQSAMELKEEFAEMCYDMDVFQVKDIIDDMVWNETAEMKCRLSEVQPGDVIWFEAIALDYQYDRTGPLGTVKMQVSDCQEHNGSYLIQGEGMGDWRGTSLGFTNLDIREAVEYERAEHSHGFSHAD